MSIVRINAITVQEGAGEELEDRFRRRAGEVEGTPGFEGFELLRPNSGSTWYVYTRWASEEDFQAWVQSPAFKRGHAESSQQAVAHSAELLSFDVVISARAGQSARGANRSGSGS